MNNECVSTTMLNHDPDPAIPPGFGPFVSFSLGATQDSGANACLTASSSSTIQSVQINSTENQRKPRRNRRSVDYSEFDNCAEDYSQVYSIKLPGIAESIPNFLCLYSICYL
jgi:hypothetical protein